MQIKCKRQKNQNLYTTKEMRGSSEKKWEKYLENRTWRNKDKNEKNKGISNHKT